MASTSNGSSAVRAAPISVPRSIVPDSCSVTCTVTGSRLPALRIASSTPMVAILACRRSWAVSTSSTSTPPSIRAVACSSNASTIASKPICPRDGSLVVGPNDPATKRGLSLVENCWATSRASCAALRLISRTLSRRSNSPRTIELPPKVLVSTTSHPARKKSAWISRIMSGRLSTRTSLQFSLPQ